VIRHNNALERDEGESGEEQGEIATAQLRVRRTAKAWMMDLTTNLLSLLYAKRAHMASRF